MLSVGLDPQAQLETGRSVSGYNHLTDGGQPPGRLSSGECVTSRNTIMIQQSLGTEV